MNIATEIRNSLRKAFTLIELLVVIAIIVVLVAVSIPALKILGKSNGQKQAVNLLTSLIANAHSNALQTHSLSGIVIYDDPTSKNQSAVQLIVASNTSYTTAGGLVTYFTRIPHTIAQMLPSAIKVATLDDSSNTTAVAFKDQNTYLATAGSQPSCRVILFDENGQMVLRNRLAIDSSLSTDLSAQAWDMKGDVQPAYGVSSPGLLVYDGNDLQAGLQSGVITAPSVDSNVSLNVWIRSHSDIVIINAYTGNVIR